MRRFVLTRCSNLLCLGWALMAGMADAQRVSPLARAPNWKQLDTFQETITKSEFERLLEEVYAPGGAARGLIMIEEDHAEIVTKYGTNEHYSLKFARDFRSQHPVDRYWRPARSMPPAPVDQPLQGIKIALDPGHIGGEWAQIEERWFQIGKTEPVREGTMTLAVARRLAPRLEAAGAEVLLVRHREQPLTDLRPKELMKSAEQSLHDRGVSKTKVGYDGHADPTKETSVLWESEKLFYRVSEIRKRAEIVNEKLRPDLTVCLHFNAEAWGDPAKPTLAENNHLHLLINGNYAGSELDYDDMRWDMLVKLLNRSFFEELAAAETVASVFAQESLLPRYFYKTPNAAEIGVTGYVWTRNLLANRLFECPVIYVEPYVMNSLEVFERFQLGDYDGEQMVAGRARKSLYREYSDAVYDGLIRYYSETRPRKAPTP